MRQKLILLLIIAIHCCVQLNAQAPQGINYQAAIRNGSGNVLASTNVIFRFSIMQGSAAGTVVYQETQAVTTNAQGLANAVIGKGTAVSGSFTAIAWGTDPYFIKTEANSGTGFVDIGTQQLMSVPYSLYAGNAAKLDASATIAPGQLGSSGATSGQVLQWNGSAWIPTTMSQGVLTDATLSGTGETGKELRLAPQGATAGQALKWNGSSWTPANETVTGAGTGITLDGNGIINTPWTANGSNIYNNNADNVGIGTDNPAAKLHIAGASGEMARVEYDNSAWMGFYKKKSYIGYLGLWNDTAMLDFGSSGSGKGLNLVTGAVPRLTIDNSGNVGIGTTTPGGMLDIRNLSSDCYVTSRSGGSANSSMFRAANNLAYNLDVYKNGSAVAGSYVGMPAANMAGITNAIGSMAISTSDSMALGAGGSARMTLKKTGEVMVNGTSSFTANSGYLTVGYPLYNSNKPAFEMNGGNVWMGFKNGSTIKGYIQQNTDNMNIASMNGDLTLYSNNIQRVFIKKAGNVGIGTSSPKADLQIEGAGIYRPAGVYSNSSSASSFTAGDTGTLAVYNNYTGTNYSYAFTAISKGISGYGTYLNSKYCGIRADVAGGTNTSYGGYFTSSSSNVSNYGSTGIANGTGSGNNYGVYGNASGGAVNYAMYCSGNGVYTGTWGSTSDQRLKKEIQPLGSSLDLVMKLKPSSYLYRTDDPKYKSMNLATGTHYGFIAQELETVIPAIVSNNVHKVPMSEEAAVEFKAVNYTELIPVLTKAIQEQQELIKALEDRIKQLENKATN